MNRRAALQMSIQSIIVFVLAFIVMGALIGVINVIIGQIETGVSRLDIGEISNPATENDPALIDNGNVLINRNEQKTVQLSFYNKRYIVDADTTCTSDGALLCGWDELEFEVTQCSGDTEYTTGSSFLPSIQAKYIPDFDERLERGGVAGFETVLNENGMDAGKYTCLLEVDAAYDTSPNAQLARNQFILEVQ